jgi:serine/threonine protein kinase
VLRIVRWAFPQGNQYAEIHTEYAERGSVEGIVTERKRGDQPVFWTPTRLAIAICDMVLGMRFVHFQGIVHYDLKPSNVLIREGGRALIGDFGSSHFKSDDATWTGVLGTVHYAAPELLVENPDLTPKVDVWGFGLILYEILTGSAVFPRSLSLSEVHEKLRNRYRPPAPNGYGEYIKRLIRRCWSQDPSSRPTFDEILQEFQARQFAIILNVDCQEVRSVVEDVLKWEEDAGVSQPIRQSQLLCSPVDPSEGI